MTIDDLNDLSASGSSPIDRDKLKIASFRTREGVWADFTTAANAIGLTATDVLKAAMEQFINGEYSPAVNTGIHTSVSTQPTITRDEIQELISTAISTLLIPKEKHVDSIVSTSISTMLVPILDDVENLKAELLGLKNLVVSGGINKSQATESVKHSSSIVQAKEWISNRSDGGLSRDEFAAFIGVDTTTISRWESGKRKPSKDNADLFDRFKVIESIWYPNTDIPDLSL